MEISEILLVTLIVVVVVPITYFINKAPNPIKHFIKTITGILFLSFIWFYFKEATFGWKLIFTAIIISSNYYSYRKWKKGGPSPTL